MAKVIIREENCYKCGFCMLFNICDNDAIRGNSKDIDKITKVYIDNDKCIGCLNCVSKANCDSFAIISDDGKEIKASQKFWLNNGNCVKPVIRKSSDIKFEDGVISKYGKYITNEDIAGADLQYLEMKPHTEDAHVHDKETEIMLLWGGQFVLWVKDKETCETQVMESKGEQTCMMIPPGYAHGVKSIGDEIVKIVIIYIPGIDNWP